jgi:hypothetical protein
LAEHINQPGARVAAGVYSGTFLAIAILFDLLWRYASRDRHLLARNHDAASVAAITRQYRSGPISYLIAFLLAFLSVWASIGMCMLLAVYFALPGLPQKRKGSG